MDDEMTDGDKSEIYFRPPARVLVVDDSHLNRSFVSNAFTPPNFDILVAENGREGIEKAKAEQPELILLDIMMPEMDGYEAGRELKNDPETRDIPIIYITALDAIDDKLRAFESGAVDFVTKPFNHKELIARVRTNVELRRAVIQNHNMLELMMEEKREATIARVAAGVSHNFNNMLGVSFGNVMLVESLLGDKIDPMAKDALKDVRTSFERMQALIRQFLLLANHSTEARGGQPEPSFFKISDICADVVDNINFQYPDQDLTGSFTGLDSFDQELKVYCDGNHLSEALHLMFRDILETTRHKAQFELKVRRTEDGPVELEATVNGFSLSSDLDIFEPFALPIANVGTGLSFAVAKNLVELNRGNLTAELLPESVIFTAQLPSNPA